MEDGILSDTCQIQSSTYHAGTRQVSCVRPIIGTRQIPDVVHLACIWYLNRYQTGIEQVPVLRCSSGTRLVSGGRNGTRWTMIPGGRLSGIWNSPLFPLMKGTPMQTKTIWKLPTYSSILVYGSTWKSKVSKKVKESLQVTARIKTVWHYFVEGYFSSTSSTKPAAAQLSGHGIITSNSNDGIARRLSWMSC